MKRNLLTTLLLLATACSAFAGDTQWWATRIWGFSFGVGEISNHILIYWGDSAVRTPFPSGHKWLVLYQIAAATVVLTITFFAFRRRRV
jgi:hypothetical protein